MNDDDRNGTLESEDRLPWLEAVESDEEDEGLSASKLLGFLLAALIALGVVLGGVWWLRSQGEGPNGDGSLIAAAEGDYKVKPGDPGGMKVEGQGDASFDASEGAEANGKVDMAAKPETPMAANKAPAVPAGKPVAAGASVTAPIANSGALAPDSISAQARLSRPALDCAASLRSLRGRRGAARRRQRRSRLHWEHDLGNQLEQPDHCGRQTRQYSWRQIGGRLCLALGRGVQCPELERGRPSPPRADSAGPRLATGSGRLVAWPGLSGNDSALHGQPVRQ